MPGKKPYVEGDDNETLRNIGNIPRVIQVDLELP